MLRARSSHVPVDEGIDAAIVAAMAAGAALFAWVAGAGLPVVAGGDVHRAAHLGGWKTLLPCARDEQAVVDYLRTSRPVYLTTLERVPERLAA